MHYNKDVHIIISQNINETKMYITFIFWLLGVFSNLAAPKGKDLRHLHHFLLFHNDSLLAKQLFNSK